jgi:hypothetical protein
MKSKKIFRLLGVMLLLTLLLAAVPAAPAVAVGETLVINPAQVKIGDRVNYSGIGLLNGSETEYALDIYITDQAVSLSTYVDTTITRYKRVVNAEVLETNGTFSGYFMLNATNSILNEGTTGVLNPLTLVAGGTYTVFSTGIFTSVQASDPTYKNISVKAWYPITITPGAALDALSPATGPAGTLVGISGSNFPASTALVFQIDGVAVTPTSGHTATLASGLFFSNITIPSTTTAGAHTITVTAGTIVLTSTFTVTAAATLDPLSPTSGAAGTDVVITGSNFPASTAIVFKFDTTVLTPKSGNAQTGSGGSFASVITIPASASTGVHNIFVTVGSVTASKEFTVTSAATTTPTPTATATPTPTPTSSKITSLSISSNGNAVGSTIVIVGTGFNVNTNMTVKYDDAAITGLTAVKSDATGTFVATFLAPAGKKGDHIVSASDGTNTSKATFKMEETAPKVPPPLKPALGDKVKSPIIFDWQEVTDVSLPVTYRLQVSTDKTFATGTIVIEKILERSDYTLTELEELKLATNGTPYYWRVKSIDAATNESEWTGAGEFYVRGPFALPKWVLYTLIAVGAIVVFLLGVWIGRRTAFSY